MLVNHIQLAAVLAMLAGCAFAGTTPINNGVLQTNLRCASNRVVELAAPVAGMDAANKTYVDATVSAGSTGIVAGAYISGSGVAGIPTKATGLVDQVAFNTYTSAVPGSITNAMGIAAVLGVSPNANALSITNLNAIYGIGGAGDGEINISDGSLGGNGVGNTFHWLNKVLYGEWHLNGGNLDGGGNVPSNFNYYVIDTTNRLDGTAAGLTYNGVTVGGGSGITGLTASASNAGVPTRTDASNWTIGTNPVALWTGTTSICVATGLQNFATGTYNTLVWDSAASTYAGNIISNKWYMPPTAGKYVACYSIIATNFSISGNRKDIIHGIAVGGASSFISPMREGSIPFAVAVTDFKSFNGSVVINLATSDLVSVTIYNGGAPLTSVWGPASSGVSGGRYFQIGRIE